MSIELHLHAYVIYGFVLDRNKCDSETKYHICEISSDSKIQDFCVSGYYSNDFFGMKFELEKTIQRSQGTHGVYEIPDTNKLYEQFLKETTEDERNFFLKLSKICQNPPKFMFMNYVSW